MRGSEVAARAVTTFLEVARRRGLDAGALVSGLWRGDGDLNERSARVSWKDYATFLERLEIAAGGPEGIAALVSDATTASRSIRLLAGSYDTAAQLDLLLWAQACSAFYSCMVTRAEALPDGRVLIERRALPGYSFSPAYHHAAIGGLRAYPRLVGRRDAQVEGRFEAGRLTYLVTPPPSPPAAARGRRRVAPDLGPPIEDAELVLDSTSLQLAACAIGHRLSVPSDAESFAGETVRLLGEVFGCRRARLWLPDRGGELALVAEHRSDRAEHADPSDRAEHAGHATLLRRQLTVGAELVGCLEVDHAPTMREPGSLYERLLPWIATLAHRHRRGASAAPFAGRATGIDALAHRLGLTPRQRQVLALVAEGLSNKEIAQRLGASVKTVEVHVSQVLRKAGVSSRAAILARALGSRGG